jgi:hypothetical protein
MNEVDHKVRMSFQAVIVSIFRLENLVALYRSIYLPKCIIRYTCEKNKKK